MIKVVVNYSLLIDRSYKTSTYFTYIYICLVCLSSSMTVKMKIFQLWTKKDILGRRLWLYETTQTQTSQAN